MQLYLVFIAEAVYQMHEIGSVARYFDSPL